MRLGEGSGRGGRGRHDQGRRRLPQRHGDLRRGRGGGEGERRERRVVGGRSEEGAAHGTMRVEGGRRLSHKRSSDRTTRSGRRSPTARPRACRRSRFPPLTASCSTCRAHRRRAQRARDRRARRLFDDLDRPRPARGGRLVTLEANARHAAVAQANLARAGLSERVEIRVGAALDSLPKIEGEGLPPFDFVFIDADKENNASYLAWALRLSRPGTTIVVDNVVRGGRVLDAASRDQRRRRRAKNVRDDGERAALSATAVQTVGAIGLGRLRARGCRVRARDRQFFPSG